MEFDWPDGTGSMRTSTQLYTYADSGKESDKTEARGKAACDDYERLAGRETRCAHTR